MRFILSALLLLIWIFFYLLLLKDAKRRVTISEEDNEKSRHDIRSAFNPIGEAIIIRVFRQGQPYKWDEKKKNALLFISPYKLESFLYQRERDLSRDVFLMLGLAGPLLLAGNIYFIILSFFIGLRIFESDYSLAKKAREIKKLVQADLPDMLTQYILSIRSGALPLGAWQEISDQGQGPLYKEMREIYYRIKTGENLSFNFRTFGKHFDLEEIRKTGELIADGLETGAGQMVENLEALRSSIFEKRRREYSIRSARAEQEMVFPSLLLFLGIIILMILPMLAGGI